MSDPQALAQRFFPGTASSYDRVVNRFTLGLDRYWKWQLIKAIPSASRVLDLACGTGIVTTRVHEKFPNASFVGVDLTRDYLDEYKRRTQQIGIQSDYVLGNAEDAPLEGIFDVVISSYLPKYVDPERLVSHIAPHVASAGYVVLHDFTLPSVALWRGIWHGYNWIMNGVGIRLFPQWREVFSGKLTHLIEKTDWFDKFPKSLQRYGFEKIQRRSLSWGSAGLIIAVKS